jgi:hypothetical protein
MDVCLLRGTGVETGPCFEITCDEDGEEIRETQQIY